MATSYYINLYKDDNHDFSFIINQVFSSLDNNDLNLIGGSISPEEVKDSLVSMNGLKVSGRDSIHAVFYQSRWDLVGTDLYRLVEDIFSHPHKVGEINETLVTLIPKVELVSSLKQMRPINLCNISLSC
ncbi:hypothetical protein AHAS_Ahas12G0065600 [Arachis hypogaea]